MAITYALVSGKGGVGKSTLTAGLGAAFVALGKRVLLIDCDIGLRSLDLMHGVSERLVYDWGDILAHRCEPEQGAIAVHGLHLLCAPLSRSNTFTPEAFHALLSLYHPHFDLILLDASAGLGNSFRLAGTAADSPLVVTTPDAVSARAAGLAVEALSGLTRSTPRLLINRFSAAGVQRGLLCNVDELIDAAGAQLIGVIPEDPDFSDRTGRGAPAFLQSGAGIALIDTAKRLLGEEIPLKHLEKLGNI